jgi:hypothetical protein
MNIRNKRWLSVFTLLICGMLVATGIEAQKGGGNGGGKDNPKKTKAELIVFTGDLEGSQEVVGCCPNAGPFPEYTMELSFAVKGSDYYTPADTLIYGELFISGYSIGQDSGYIVQFSNEHSAENHVAFEIRGGEVSKDKKTKEVKVVFTDAECRDQHDPKDLITYVNFTLVRTPN